MGGYFVGMDPPECSGGSRNSKRGFQAYTQFSQPGQYILIATRKIIPITGRARSFLLFLEFSKTKIERRG